MAAVTAALGLLAGTGPSASAAVCGPASATDIVAPSCFEGGDGNLTADNAQGPGRIDWRDANPHAAASDGTGNTDNSFGVGSDDMSPAGWVLVTQSPPQKSDLIATASRADTVSGSLFLYGAFERADQSNPGNANLTFELNRVLGTFDNDNDASTPEVPVRSEGDLAITFDGNGATANVGMCIWHGDRFGKTTQHPDYGWYTLPGFGVPGAQQISAAGPTNCTPLSSSEAIGGANDASALNNNTDNLPGNPNGAPKVLSTFEDPIPKDLFGEFSVNITAALRDAGLAPCLSAEQIWVHSRSSDAITATMRDYVAPQPEHVAATCSIAVDKTVAVQPPSGATGSSHQGTPADPAYANDGDTLHYAFAVTNQGTTTAVLDSITDARCDAAPTLDPADKHDAQGAADATPNTLDAGDVWTFRCPHVLAAADTALPTDPYPNTVTVAGHVGATPITATDSANVLRYATVDVTKTEGGATPTRGWPFRLTGGPNTVTIDRTADAQTPAVTFGSLLPGTYTLCETAVPSGWHSSLEFAPVNAPNVGGDVCLTRVLSSGQVLNLAVDNSHPLIGVVAQAEPSVHRNGTVHLAFDVTNPGNVPLHGVTLTDPACQTPVVRDASGDRNSDADGLLENRGTDGTTSESWRFSCTATAPSVAGQVAGTATAGASDGDGVAVSGTDGHTTTVITPGIKLDEQVRIGQGAFGDGPVTTRIGDTLDHRFTVTNTGDTPLTVATPVASSCDGALAGPVKAGGNQDPSLDAGETWTWTCSHTLTAADPAALTSVATVTGTDAIGGAEGTVTSTDRVDVSVSAAAGTATLPFVVPVPPGAKTTQCVSRRVFTLHLIWRPLRRFHATVLRATLRTPHRAPRRLRHTATTMRVDLRGLPRARVTVTVVARLRSKAPRTYTRTYRTCFGWS